MTACDPPADEGLSPFDPGFEPLQRWSNARGRAGSPLPDGSRRTTQAEEDDLRCQIAEAMTQLGAASTALTALPDDASPDEILAALDTDPWTAQ